MYSKEDPLKLKVINCKNYIYIANEDYYGNKDLTRYLFDGEDRWFKILDIPKVVSAKQEDKRINIRYELKAGYTATELMPQIITKEMKQSEEYDEVIGLYNYKYDTIPGEYEPIEFEIKEIYTREDFEFVQNVYGAETSLLTQIEYPEEAYQDKPCKIDSKRMLQIIRNYVKANIDTSVATITSDYEFHFEVKKRIPLADPYNILVDKNLTELISQINKKYCECPTCKGWGIIEGE